MGKTIRRILLIIIIIGVLVIIFTGKYKTIIDLVKSKTDNFIYTGEYKVNSLQFTKEDFYYNSLTDNQKKVYSAIARASNELTNEVLIPSYELASIDNASDDTKKAINAFLNDHPEVFYLNSQYTVSLTDSLFGKIFKLQLNYSVANINELNSKITTLDSEIDDVIHKISGSTDYEKELFVHDYLAKKIKYYSEYEENEEDKYHSVYNALVENEAVCDGISKAFQIILNKLGIENYIVTGYINDTPHAWNLVKIEDEWVYVDITSDKFVKDDSGNTIEAVHTYFNVNKDFILKNHKLDDEDLLPESTATDKTYYEKSDSKILIKDNFDKRVEEVFEKQKDRKIVEFSTDIKLSVPEKLVKKLQDMKFNKLKTEGNKITMTYYNEQDVYIIPKV